MPASRRSPTPVSDPDLRPLFTRLYDDLCRLAALLRRNRGDADLATASLVHEAYLKLAVSSADGWEDEQHFVRVAARAMRQLLIDAYSARTARKRGGADLHLTTLGEVPAPEMDPHVVLDLDRALTRLAERDERAAQVVELRFFGGLTLEEVAGVLDVSLPTVKRDWRLARAWLQREMGGS